MAAITGPFDSWTACLERAREWTRLDNATTIDNEIQPIKFVPLKKRKRVKRPFTPVAGTKTTIGTIKDSSFVS